MRAAEEAAEAEVVEKLKGSLCGSAVQSAVQPSVQGALSSKQQQACRLGLGGWAGWLQALWSALTRLPEEVPPGRTSCRRFPGVLQL